MIEKILVGVVIALALIIFIIILISGIKGIKNFKKERNKDVSEEKVKVKEKKAKKAKTEVQEEVDIEPISAIKAKRVEPEVENNPKLDVVEAQPEVKSDPKLEEVKQKEETLPNSYTLVMGEPVVIGSDTIPAGEYSVYSEDETVTSFKVRISRNVNEYTNGSKISFNENQKVTSLTTTLTLK